MVHLEQKDAQIGEETCQLSRGTFFSFTFVAVRVVTFLKVILELPKNVLISNFLILS